MRALIDPRQDKAGARRYWVVLTLGERTNGQFSAPRYFEGPLNLEAFQAEYEQSERGDFRYGQSLFNALFPAKGIPQSERRTTRADPGDAPSLLTGYIDTLAGGNNVPLRIQVRIDSKAVELPTTSGVSVGYAEWADTRAGGVQRPGSLLACSAG